MAIVDWIDEIGRTFELSFGGDQRTLKYYSIVDREEFPAALDLPCVLVIPENDQGEYSTSEGSWKTVKGVAEFHLVKNTEKSRLPFVLSFWDKIITAAAANIGLNDPANIQFYLDNESGPRIELAVMSYSGEEEHLGLLVRWSVFENDTDANRTQVGL